VNKPVTKQLEPILREHPVSSERPIKTLAEDELGRRDFAEAVAKVILQWGGRDSLVLAIYGPWGSGKSSLKNMILDALPKQKSKTILMEFNPWEWAGQEKVFEGFFGELSAKLGSEDASKDASRAAKKVRMYGAMLSAAASITGVIRWLLIGFLAVIGFFGFAPLLGAPRIVLATFGALAVVTALILAALGRTTDKVAAYLSARAEATSKSVAEVKKDIQTLLKTFKKDVLVVIDDVDRLTPDGIRMVFQLVKANADFPNLVYLLLLQRDTVEKALDGPSGFGQGYGAQFLEKVVQVGFDIPRLSSGKLEEMLESAIGRIVQGTPAESKFDSRRWGKLFVSAIKPYFRTLRDVKRFSNTLSFHFELYRNGDTFDANPIDLIALEVLRQFEGTVYQKLHGSEELLTGHSRSTLGGGLSSGTKQSAEELIESAIRPSEVRDLLANVFPPFAWAMSQSKDKASRSVTHTGTFQKEWLKDLRACHPEAFERYFCFSLSEDELTENEMSSLLAVAGDRNSFVQKLRQLNEKRLLDAAIVRLGVVSPSISSKTTVSFATGLFDMERELFVQPSRGGVARVSISLQTVLIIRSVLQQRPVDERGPMLREVTAQTTALYLPMISFESSDKERKEAIDPLLSEQEAISLQQLCIKKIRAAILNSELLSNPWIRYILQFWSKWASEEEVSTWFVTTSESESGLFSLLAAFVETMNELGDTGRTVGVQCRFALEEFGRYIKPDDLVERVRRLDPSNDTQKIACRLFLRAFDRWKSSGQTPYPQDMGAWETLDQV
jgi:predicted KAP-like P-loop ATPase